MLREDGNHQELGEEFDLTSGSMTAAINRLETRHLVARANHATDRRAWVIHLTPAGKALITKVFAGHQNAMENAMSGLSRAERATLTDLLKRLGTARPVPARRRSNPMTATLEATKTARAIDKMHSEVTFQVRHLLTKVRGRFTEFAGTMVFEQEHPEQSSASLTIDASSVDTGTPDRDTHLQSDDFSQNPYHQRSRSQARGSSRRATIPAALTRHDDSRRRQGDRLRTRYVKPGNAWAAGRWKPASAPRQSKTG